MNPSYLYDDQGNVITDANGNPINMGFLMVRPRQKWKNSKENRRAQLDFIQESLSNDQKK